eukprot:TRINITY_DN40258_c0_g1_i1.p3 TRINITY_DN40258_c0_g1~~TRINITY_DN40258_c0_g1_i1.p3  ORF type:complete len:279 (+),score=100.82 TRINITY_DN40258_c0_g1_i1:74-910(+)
MAPHRATWVSRVCWIALGFALSRALDSVASTRAADATRGAPGMPSLQSIGVSVGDDKVTVHRYHRGYEKHLEHLRDEPLRMLEIGLGCDATGNGTGPGRSVQLWGRYVRRASLDVAEFAADCAKRFEDQERQRKARGEPWAPTGGFRMYIGDQQDRDFLAVLKAAAPAGGWDVVIDDGGHHPRQQITSFEALWPAVAPGGMYVIEDIQTSFWTLPGAPPLDPPVRRGQMPFTDFLASQVAVKLHTVVRGGGWEVDNGFRSEVDRVDCWHFVCFVFKKR